MISRPLEVWIPWPLEGVGMCCCADQTWSVIFSGAPQVCTAVDGQDQAGGSKGPGGGVVRLWRVRAAPSCWPCPFGLISLAALRAGLVGVVC